MRAFLSSSKNVMMVLALVLLQWALLATHKAAGGLTGGAYSNTLYMLMFAFMGGKAAEYGLKKKEK